jgi:hypothetical protein
VVPLLPAVVRRWPCRAARLTGPQVDATGRREVTSAARLEQHRGRRGCRGCAGRRGALLRPLRQHLVNQVYNRSFSVNCFGVLKPRGVLTGADDLSHASTAGPCTASALARLSVVTQGRARCAIARAPRAPLHRPRALPRSRVPLLERALSGWYQSAHPNWMGLPDSQASVHGRGPAVVAANSTAAPAERIRLILQKHPSRVSE